MDLHAVIEQAIEAARPLADAAGHHVRLVSDVDAIHLSADAVRLGQVFGNLLNNSCKYTDPGGTITVRVARRARRGRGDRSKIPAPAFRPIGWTASSTCSRRSNSRGNGLRAASGSG